MIGEAMTRAAPILLPMTLLLSTTARGDWNDGLATGEAHVVVVTSNPTAGLEAGMPRTSAYAAGIDLDLRQQWQESYRAYRRARGEFREMLAKRPRWRETIKGWLAKAEFQIEQSRRLMQQAHFGHWSWQSHRVSAHTHYYRATAKHNKWLSIRAFTGRAPRALLESTIKDYEAALQQRPNYTLARMGLAGLHHEAGQHERGRQHFRKIRGSPPRWMATALAYYHTAAGDTAKALDLLERAVRYSSSNSRHIYRSNDFDRLRSHPRFRALVADRR
jgi:tetratricopeptide (TPR) repeat protein